ncbi:MAG TPA: hypothetical protein ENI86_05595 [Acidimicrobiales bacterium]|nr:hypothetical protein [Acidimicrobiales bacterium]
MGFPDDYLREDEELVLNLKPHWWVFAQPVALLVGAIVLAALLSRIDSGFTGWVAVILVLASLVYLAVVYTKWATTFFVLTDNRLIFRTGVAAKRGVEIPIDRINNINFHQGLFERLIGAGDLLIESAGEAGQSRFSNVRKPEAIQNEIHHQIDRQKSRRSGHGGETPVSAPSIATQIEDLAALRDKGLISDEEFETKRKQLLDRM